MKPVVKYVITDVHMGLEHVGLTEVIRAHKKKNPLFAKAISTGGGLILFTNKSRTAAKLFSDGGEVLGYLRLHNSTLNERSIDLIPKTFSGSVEYASAVQSAFKKLFTIDKAKKRVSIETQLYVE